MTNPMGAIKKGFLHLFTTNDWTRPGEARHVVTILDVLEPRSPRG